MTAINAFNMLDCMDGLAGTIAFVSLAALLGGAAPGQADIAVACPAISAATAAFLLFTSRCAGIAACALQGDAGSTLLGVSLAWVSIRSASILPVLRPLAARSDYRQSRHFGLSDCRSSSSSGRSSGARFAATRHCARRRAFSPSAAQAELQCTGCFHDVRCSPWCWPRSAWRSTPCRYPRRSRCCCCLLPPRRARSMYSRNRCCDSSRIERAVGHSGSRLRIWRPPSLASAAACRACPALDRDRTAIWPIVRVFCCYDRGFCDWFDVINVQFAQRPHRHGSVWATLGCLSQSSLAALRSVGFDLKPQRIRALKGGRDSTLEVSSEELR